MQRMFDPIVKNLKKELKRYGYRLTYKPSISLPNDLTAKDEKLIGEKMYKIFSTRDRKELLQGVNLILKLERLQEVKA